MNHETVKHVFSVVSSLHKWDPLGQASPIWLQKISEPHSFSALATGVVGLCHVPASSSCVSLHCLSFLFSTSPNPFSPRGPQDALPYGRRLFW